MRMAKTLGEMECTDHTKASLLDEGVLDSLLNLVSHGNIEMKKVAVKALLNLSTLMKNGQEMIIRGAVRPLLDILSCHTLHQDLCELAAATITHLAQSTVHQDSSLEVPVALLESHKDTCHLFSLINLTWSSVQQSVLQAFHAICCSPSAATVKEQLIKECCDVQVLLQLCELDNPQLRANATKLLSCLIEDCDEATVSEIVRQKTVQTLLEIIKDSENEEEIASAMGIISMLPMSTEVSNWLLEADGLPIILKFLGSGKQNIQLLENVVGALCIAG